MDNNTGLVHKHVREKQSLNVGFIIFLITCYRVDFIWLFSLPL